jgi:hypothetical protein
MAMLITTSFPDDHDGKAMLAKVKKAFRKLTMAAPEEGDGYLGYFNAPVRLRKGRDMLKDNYDIIWIECLFEYDDDEHGASIFVPKREIKIGPYFMSSRFSHVDMEKIILHEYLHAALDIRSEFAHGQMEQIIKYNLGYPGPWNPAEGATT